MGIRLHSRTRYYAKHSRMVRYHGIHSIQVVGKPDVNLKHQLYQQQQAILGR